MSTTVEETKKRKPQVQSTKAAKSRKNVFSSMFEFGKITSKKMDSMKNSIDTSGNGPVVSEGPEIKAIFGSVITPSVNGKKAYVHLIPYESSMGSSTNPMTGLGTVVIESRRATDSNGEPVGWRDREVEPMELPLGVGFATNMDPKKIPMPGEPIVLFGVNANIVASGATYVNVHWWRGDGNSTFDDGLKSILSTPLVMDNNSKAAFAVLPEAAFGSYDFNSMEKSQVGTISTPTLNANFLDGKGDPDIRFQFSLKVARTVGGETGLIGFSNINIFKSMFQKTFMIHSKSIISALGCSILARSKMILDGDIKSLDEMAEGDDEDAIQSGTFYVKNIIANLKDMVTSLGLPVSADFVKKNLRKGEETNEEMKMNQGIVFLNECSNFKKVSNFYTLPNYKFYVVCNVCLDDEASGSAPTMYDSVLTRHANKGTVYAFYAVRD